MLPLGVDVLGVLVADGEYVESGNDPSPTLDAPLVSVPAPIDAKASRARRLASGVSGTSDRPLNPFTSSGRTPTFAGPSARLAAA